MREKRLDPKIKGFLALLSFLIPCAVLTAIYCFSGIYPFGGTSFHFELPGMNGSEWFSSVSKVHSAILGGGNLFYSFSGGLGADFYTLFSSGLCSPFLLLTVFFKENALHEALALVMCVKAGCAGLFSFLMMTRTSRERPYLAVPFSVAYASGSLTVLGFLAPQLSDCAVFLPLVGLGTALLVDKGSVIVLFIGYLLFFLSSGTMWQCCVIFSIITLIWIREMHGRKKVSLLTQIALMLISLSLSAASAMALFIPSVSALVESGTAVAKMSEVDAASFSGLLSGLFPAVSPDLKGDVLLTGFTSLLCIVLIVVYFFNKSFRQKERLLAFFSAAILLISAAVQPMQWLLSCFSRPTGVVVGTSFALCLIICIASARALARSERLTVGTVIKGWGISLAIYLAAAAFGGFKRFTLETIIFTVAFMTLFAAASLIVMSGKRGSGGACALLTLLVVVETILGGTLTVSSVKEELPLESYAQYRDSLVLDSQIEDTVKSQETGTNGFFRVRGTDASGLYSISGGCPTQTAHSSLLLNVLGISGKNGFTHFTDAFFGVKYAVGQTEQGSRGTVIGTDGTNVITRSESTLPLCFAASSEVLTLNDFSSDPFEAQNRLATAVCGAERALFTETEYTSSGSGVSFVETLGGIELTRSSEEGYVSFTAIAPCDGTMYMYMKCSTESSEKITVNGAEVRTQPLDSIVSLGKFSRGESVYVDVTVHSERALLDSVIFASLDENLLSAALEQLSASAAQYIQVDGNRVSGSISLEEGQVMLTTIPYQQGWTCDLDRGTEEPISCAVGSLAALDVGAGTHGFVLEYTPPDFKPAIIISAVSAALGLIFAAVAEVRRREHPLPDEPEPRGERPIDDFADAASGIGTYDPVMLPYTGDSFMQRQSMARDGLLDDPNDVETYPDTGSGLPPENGAPPMPQGVYPYGAVPYAVPYMMYGAPVEEYSEFGVYPDQPPYDDFAAMAAARGYDPEDMGHYDGEFTLPTPPPPPPRKKLPEEEELPRAPKKPRSQS